MTAIVRPARPGEGALIHALVSELAAYERLVDEVRSTPADFEAALFGREPRVFTDIAELGGEPAGMALWFYNFSTFAGCHGIWLEDLYVRPEARGLGAGRALLACLAQRCAKEGLARLEWWVLDWNEPALRFYRSLGAEPMNEWTMQRLTGDALARLAEEGPPALISRA